jgi:23S rRNA (cytosine1962-C5)-methyltransferase
MEHRRAAACHGNTGSGVPAPLHSIADSCLHHAHSLGNQALLSTRSHRSPARPGVRLATVTPRGAERWVRGHPWIYRSEVLEEPGEPGLVQVQDARGKFLGQALYSPASEIRLRLLERTDQTVNQAWWHERIAAALARRKRIDATAYRVVHGEGDGLPSLVVDRYDRWLVIQVLSAGLETLRDPLVSALLEVLQPQGILLRNDVPVRRREGLNQEPELVHGAVPAEIEAREGRVRYLAAPWTGQKTGAFLDQRPNRLLAGELMPPGGRALDCFTYHGSFALHLAQGAGRVLALDSSREALSRGAVNAALNRQENIDWQEADAPEALRQMDRARERFDAIVLDPPAFAKSRSAVPGALRGYREINLRALRILAPGGFLLTASCSFHVRLPQFLAMLAEAAGDSGRRVIVERILGQGEDHPELLTVPETGYLKGAVLRVVG